MFASMINHKSELVSNSNVNFNLRLCVLISDYIHKNISAEFEPLHTVQLKSKLPPLASRLTRREARGGESRLARTNEAYILE